MNNIQNNPVENPLQKSSVKKFTVDNTTFHTITLICSLCESRGFVVTITGDSFFCHCDSCGANHQLSAYKSGASTEKTVADLLVQEHQPVVDVVEVAA